MRLSVPWFAKGKRKISVEAVKYGSHCDYCAQRLEAQVERRCFVVEFFDVHAEDSGDERQRKVEGGQ